MVFEVVISDADIMAQTQHRGLHQTPGGGSVFLDQEDGS